MPTDTTCWRRGWPSRFALLVLAGCTCGVAAAAEPGLPLFEDYADTTLRDAARTTANWSEKEQALRIAYRNARAGAFDPALTSGVNISTVVTTADAIELGDLNGDGHLDIVTGDDDWVFLNNGTGEPFADVPGIALPALPGIGATKAIAITDMDGDGDQDLVLGQYQASISYVLLNSGGADPIAGSTYVPLASDTDYTVALAVGDVNGDGRPDVITGNRDAANKLYLNNGTPALFDGAPGLAVGANVDTVSLALADVDSDGDLDLVSGDTGSEPLRLFLNDGSAVPFVGDPGTPLPNSALSAEVLAMGDVDGDGDVDVVSGTRYGSTPGVQVIRVLVNDGTPDPFGSGQFSDIDLPAELTYATDLELLDTDGDGDLDVIVTSFGTANILFENNGTDKPFSGVSAVAFAPDAQSTAAAAVGDVDGDGDVDLVVGNLGQPARLYANRSRLNPFESAPGVVVTAGFNPADSCCTMFRPVVADFDGDGDLDLIAQEIGPAPATSGLRFYANNGGADPFAGVTPVDIDCPDYLRDMIAGDVDDDGDIDLVLGRGDAGVCFNDGTSMPFSGTPYQALPLPAEWNQVDDWALGDVDGDGDTDLVAANFHGPDFVFLNDGSDDPYKAGNVVPVSSDELNTKVVLLGDVDRDGDLDLLAGTSDGLDQRDYLYLNDGTSMPFSSAGLAMDGGLTESATMTLGDVDGDGYLDLVAGGYSSLRLYLNDRGQNPYGQTHVEFADSTLTAVSVSLTDADRDGDLDLLVGYAGVPNRLYTNDGSATAFSSDGYVEIGENARSTMGLVVGDVDRDGAADIVERNNLGSGVLYLSESSPKSFVGLVADPIGAGSRDTLAIAVGDLDNDGLVDVVAGNAGAEPQNRIFLNQGSGSPFEGAVGADVGSEGDDTAAVALADVDRDGDLDVLTGNAGPNRLYRNAFDPATGFQGFAASDLVGPFDADDTRALAVGDVDGDGHPDVVAGNAGVDRLYLGVWSVTLGFEGFDTGADVDPGHSGVTESVALADVDGDGDLDLVAGGPGVNRLYLNDTDPVLGFKGFVSGPDVGAADFADTRAIGIGDLDRDGDLDVVAGNAGVNRLYLNDTDPVLGFQGFAPGMDVGPDHSDTTAALLVSDVDLDGDLDVLTANRDGPNRVYLGWGNSQPFAAVEGREITPVVQDSPALGLADLDRDGSPDVVVGNVGDQNVAYLVRGAHDTGRGIGVSIEVDSVTDIYSATLVPDASIPANTRIRWYLSNDAGLRWHEVHAGGDGSYPEFVFPSAGDDLRWRAELGTLSPALSPSVQSLALDARLDGDGDGVPDDADGCPAIADPGQEDFDGDAVPGGSVDPEIGGDACDLDDDADGAPDLTDAAPFDAGVQNAPPEISGSPPTAAIPGAAIGFVPEVVDSAYESHTFALSHGGGTSGGAVVTAGDHATLPAWLVFDPATGSLSGVPSNDDYGAVTGIVISVEDRGDVQIPLSDALAPFDLQVEDTRAPLTLVFPGGGAYPGDVGVLLQCVESIGSGCAAVHYTTDGSEPTTGSPSVDGAGELVTVTSSATLKYFAVDAAGNAESPVKSAVYTRDTVAPALSLDVSPVDGDGIATSAPVVSGTASDADSGVAGVWLKVEGGGMALALGAGNVPELVPGSGSWLLVGLSDVEDVLPIGCSGLETWSCSTTAVPWANDVLYTVSAKSVDAAGNESPVAMDTFRFYDGLPATTSLTLTLTKSSVLFGGVLDASLKLTKLGFPGADLSGSAVSLRITDPDGVETLLDATTNATGAVEFLELGEEGGAVEFTKKGAWTVRAEYAGTALLSGSVSEGKLLLVGTSAGYAVLVQGKLPSNEGLASHNKTANRVYRTLLERGFADQNIFYFNFDPSQDANEDGIPDNGLGQQSIGVDAVPTKASIQSTIEQLSLLVNTNPAPVYVMFADHGGDELFYLGDETITPAELDGWLDTLESGLTAEALLEPRVVVAGACYSGSFIPALSAPGRLIITSAAGNEESYKGPQENDGVRVGEYFLEELFKELGDGRDFLASFEEATARTELLTRRTDGGVADLQYVDFAAQHPLLDDDGDGAGGNGFDASATDGSLAKNLILGVSPAVDTNAAEVVAGIVSVTPTLFLGDTESTATVELTPNFVEEVDHAFIEVRAPGTELTPAYGTEQLEANFDRLLMTSPADPGVDPRYTRLYESFFTPGRYEVFYYVVDIDDVDAVTGEVRRISPARQSVLYKAKLFNDGPPGPVGGDASGTWDLLAPADGSTAKTVALFDWEDASDPDGVRYTLRIAASNVLDGDGALASPVHVQSELGGSSTFVGLDAGLADLATYHWQVEAVDGFGERTHSMVWSFSTDNQNAIPGVVRGLMRSDQTLAALGAGLVQTQVGGAPRGDQSFVLEANGEYIILTLPGTFDVGAASTGYLAKTVTGVTLPPATVNPFTGAVTTTAVVVNFALSPDASAGESDLGVSVAPPPSPYDGSVPMAYVVTVSNAGPDAATGVLLSGTLPGTAQVVSAVPTAGACAVVGATLTCEVGGIASGATVDVTLTLAPQQAGVLTLDFAVGGEQAEPAGASAPNEASVQVEVLASAVTDTDGDGVVDGADNCPADWNAGQEDADADEVGDECDAFPANPDESADADLDGMGDGFETLYGVDDPDDDADDDGLTNIEEFELGTDPTSPLSPPHRDDVAMSFDGTGVMPAGFWMLYGGATPTWVKHNPNQATYVALGDIDADGIDEVAVDLSPPGLWIYEFGGGFTKVNGQSTEGLATGDVDGNGEADVVVDLGSGLGLWVKKNGGGLTKVNGQSPLAFVTGDIDGNGQDDILVDFGPASPGLWAYKNDTGFAKLNSNSPVGMAAADVDGNGQDDVVIDYGAAGLWLYRSAGGFQRISGNTGVEALAVGDLDGNGVDDVLIDFGAGGVWVYRNGASFEKLNSNDPSVIALSDIDRDGDEDVLAGMAGKLWTKPDGGAWSVLLDEAPEVMAPGNVDGL